jgi:ABC-type glycerol-3-phosphate transport system permease component
MINKILTGTFFKAVLVINALMVLLPVFFLFNTALRDSDSFGANPIEFARSPEWNNFAEVWADGEFPTFLKNSLVITLGSLVVILVLALFWGVINLRAIV